MEELADGDPVASEAIAPPPLATPADSPPGGEPPLALKDAPEEAAPRERDERAIVPVEADRGNLDSGPHKPATGSQAPARSNSPDVKELKHDGEGPKLRDLPTYLEPSFDFKKVAKQLRDPNLSVRKKMKILIGLHYRFWHAGEVDMRKMLYRGPSS